MAIVLGAILALIRTGTVAHSGHLVQLELVATTTLAGATGCTHAPQRVVHPDGRSYTNSASGQYPTSGADSSLGNLYEPTGRVGNNTGRNTGTNTTGGRGDDTGGTSTQSKDAVLLVLLVAAPGHCNHSRSPRSNSDNNISSTPGNREAAHWDPAHTYGTSSRAFTSSD